MFDQSITVEADFGAADHAPQLGYGGCNRCRSEGSPNPCYGFVGTGLEPSMSTSCQRNWCAHSFSDYS